MNSDGPATDQPTTTTICARCDEKIVNRDDSRRTESLSSSLFSLFGLRQDARRRILLQIQSRLTEKQHSDRVSTVLRDVLPEDRPEVVRHERGVLLSIDRSSSSSAKCSNLIEASSIVWKEKKFHESCFTCCGHSCGKVRLQPIVERRSLSLVQLMKDEPVYSLDDRWYCAACFDRLDCGVRAASRDILGRKCAQCQKEFPSEGFASECK